MKVNVTMGGNLVTRPISATRTARALSHTATRRLANDLELELEAVLQSEAAPDADPDVRRDALERAVRRIWGATL